MGSLAARIHQIAATKNVVTSVLRHFDAKLSATEAEKVSLAADIAFSDPLLFEKFLLWHETKDDSIFLYHVNRFFEDRESASLSESELNLTKQRKQIESSTKERVREKQKRVFSERITKLALKRKLLRNEDLGKFLGVSDEQARKFKAGEHRPQLSTLKKIADKFGVSVEYLIGLSDS